MNKHLNKKRFLLVSCAVILLCMSLIVGMTYALFTDSTAVNTHLKAGNLDVLLTRTNLVYTELTTDGDLKEVTLKDERNFTKPTDKNVFGLDSTSAMPISIVPGSYFEATMKITNQGNVAFDYTVDFTLTEATKFLAEQIQITITKTDGTMIENTRLSEYIASNTGISAGHLKAGKDATFIVRVDFLDLKDNNSVMNGEVKFDLLVSAVQETPVQK